MIEFFTITLLYSIVFFVVKGKKPLYMPLIFVSSYFVIDLITNSYNRYLDFSDFVNLPLLFDALLQSKGQVVYIFGIIPIAFFYIFIKSHTFKKYILAITLIAFIFIVPSFLQSFVSKYYIDTFTYLAFTKQDFWSPKKNINYAKTGRFSTFFYGGMKKQKIKSNITHYLGDRQKKLLQITQEVTPYIIKRNVYLIGLESFSLPDQLEKLSLDYINDNNHSYDVVTNASVVITSIFGGGTIQSEFEALCGVPALQKVSAFEFTEFTGATTNCLPTILSELGYSNIVSNTYKPQPSFEALTSVGFEDINFPQEYFPNLPSYITNMNKAKGEYAIFDSDLFSQNQSYIKEKYLHNKQPIFNYMFSVWGHAFHEMTELKRPKAIEITNAKELGISTHTFNAINQEYYRIKALQNYFDEIKLTDPNALVVAFSDHRPVLDGADNYKKYGLETDVFHNYIIIMDKGKYIKFDKSFPLYSLPDIILDRLTDSWYCKHNACKINSKNKEQYLNEYYKIMANAMNASSKSDDFTIVPGEKYFFNNPLVPFINFSQAEDNYRWNDGKSAEIQFKIKNITKLSNIINLHIGTFGKQYITIKLNNHLLYENEIDNSDLTLSLEYKKDWLITDKINILHFDLPNAKSPNSADKRVLAMKFVFLQFSNIVDKN
jgi:hypothetical protein